MILLSIYHPTNRANPSPPRGSKMFDETYSNISNIVKSRNFTSLRTLNDRAHSEPKTIAIIVFIAVALFLVILYSSVKKVIEISLMEIVDVMDAKKSSIKNAADQKYPPGICWKMLGRISKTSFGPAAGSNPKENTAGNIIIPAIIATKVSKMAIIVALLTSGVLSEKYDA